MNKNDIQWKPVIIGIIVALAFFIVFWVSNLLDTRLVVFLLAGIIVGFMVSSNYMKGALNGVITGVIGGIAIILLLFGYIIMQGKGAYLSLVINNYLIILVIQIILAAIGGALGSGIKAESLIERPEEDLE